MCKRNIFPVYSVIYRLLVFRAIHLRGGVCVLPHHCVSCLQPVELRALSTATSSRLSTVLTVRNAKLFIRIRATHDMRYGLY